MTTSQIIVTIIVSIAMIAAGIFLGSMPFKNDKTTEWQSKYQQLIGILSCGVMVILILLDFDIASWACIIALAVGIGVARIPPLHKYLLNRFEQLRPYKNPSPLTRVKKKD